MNAARGLIEQTRRRLLTTRPGLGRIKSILGIEQNMSQPFPSVVQLIRARRPFVISRFRDSGAKKRESAGGERCPARRIDPILSGRTSQSSLTDFAPLMAPNYFEASIRILGSLGHKLGRK
jgi:hypothetical protein